MDSQLAHDAIPIDRLRELSRRLDSPSMLFSRAADCIVVQATTDRKFTAERVFEAVRGWKSTPRYLLPILQDLVKNRASHSKEVPYVHSQRGTGWPQRCFRGHPVPEGAGGMPRQPECPDEPSRWSGPGHRAPTGVGRPALQAGRTVCGAPSWATTSGGA